ncbi:hypothetical protein OUZ56_021344 [Daphnia magna]|uniref:Uncharacterized protein n=1 Tax=Daphnia magna TaxID=35525 RepID=A0ABQ9ZH35_9CRUS|nr:hypothetical protein OUZ56_021344 [Daphnia magna]
MNKYITFGKGPTAREENDGIYRFGWETCREKSPLFAIAKLLATGLVNLNRVEVLWRPVTNHLLEVIIHLLNHLREWGIDVKLLSIQYEYSTPLKENQARNQNGRHNGCKEGVTIVAGEKGDWLSLHRDESSAPWTTLRGTLSWFLHKTLQPQQTNLDTNEIFAFVENVQRRMFYCSIRLKLCLFEKDRDRDRKGLNEIDLDCGDTYWSAAAAASYGETIFFTCSSFLAEEFRLLPEIRLLQGDEQQTIHKQ